MQGEAGRGGKKLPSLLDKDALIVSHSQALQGFLLFIDHFVAPSLEGTKTTNPSRGLLTFSLLKVVIKTYSGL